MEPLQWLRTMPYKPGFTVTCDGVKVNDRTAALSSAVYRVLHADGDSMHFVASMSIDAPHLSIEQHVVAYPEAALYETWLNVRNSGDQPMRIERVDSIRIRIPEDEYELMYYTSSWGKEFEMVRTPLSGGAVLETRKGRSSNDMHPWFTLFGKREGMLSASAMWSGNWIFRFEAMADGGYEICGGLHDWEFSKELQPGESMESIRVPVVYAAGSDLNRISVSYARVGRKFWYPRNELSESMPAEWNHWWSYEDKQINEHHFKRNADAAARLGLDICTLDAGWFGPTDPETFWYDYRGDWQLVNTVRFPSGIHALSDYVHDLGMKFGLWCEIEALGQHARLAAEHPDFVALRDGDRLGYVCFGSEDVQEWAFRTLDRLITDYRCDWIKLDFNLDPGAGCNRTDHGHGAGDGLYEHYQGYYRTLERIRRKHPDVILESCSSGGLRIDLGLLRHTHATFLSDPDWPEHDLQIFWGASTMLAPNVCLHWSYCDWLGDHPFQKFNPSDPNLKEHQLDYYVHISMLGGYGFSQKLPELPAWVAQRLAEHTALYKSRVSRFVREADLLRLTGQPKREGRGERWAGFQYALPDRSEHLLFLFRLHASEGGKRIFLRELEEDRLYALTWLNGSEKSMRSGRDLMENGIRFDDVPEEGSVIIHLE